MDAVKKELLMDAFADDYMTPEAIERLKKGMFLATPDSIARSKSGTVSPG